MCGLNLATPKQANALVEHKRASINPVGALSMGAAGLLGAILHCAFLFLPPGPWRLCSARTFDQQNILVA